MKKNQNKFSFVGSISKHKASAAVQKVVHVLKNLAGMEVFYSGTCHHEKLQIVYANIRV